MGGFVFALGHCFACKQPFSFNPHYVPSTPSSVTGTRQPICRSCVERANTARAKNGLDPINIHPNAYEPLPEEEL